LKKIICIILIISTCYSGLLASTQSLSASTISYEETYTYDVLSSDCNFKISNTDHAVDIFKVRSELDVTAQSTVEFTDITPDEGAELINYTMSCGADSIAMSDPYSVNDCSFINGFYDKSWMFFSYYLVLNTMSHYTGDFSLTPYADAVPTPKFLIFQYPNQSIWDYFRNVVAKWFNAGYRGIDGIGDDETFYVTTESDFIILEGNMYGELDSVNCTRGTISNGFQFVYHKTTGVLQGYKTKGTFNGYFNNIKVVCNHDFHMELVGYNMPTYSLFTSLGFKTFYFSLFLGLSVIVLPIIVKRRRRN